jgi:DNA-binding MarR family transcriptional regulator
VPIPPATPRLSAEQQAAWRSLALAMQVLDSTLDSHMQREAGMPHAHYVVLVALWEASGHELRLSALAPQLRWSQSRLSHAVRSLEGSGWVARTPDPLDRRAQLLSLTDEGRALIRRVGPRQSAEVRSAVFAQLDDAQVGQLHAISDAILTGLLSSPQSR